MPEQPGRRRRRIAGHDHVAAQQLARALAPARQSEAFIAGLLHDIGIVLLARLRPQALTRTVRK